MSHDPLCENATGTCCPWMGDCDCQCMCAFIATIREDEDQQILETLSKMRGKQRIKLLRAFRRREVYMNEAVQWVLHCLSDSIKARRSSHEVRATERV